MQSDSKLESAPEANASGRHHWLVQRVTAVVLIPLLIWFVFTVVSLTGSDYQEVVTHFSSSWRISLMMILVAVVFYHGYLGLEVVLEDYVANQKYRMWFLLITKCAAILFAIVGLVSTLRIGV